MNKLIVVNKPKNYTSRDVVNRLNHILKIKRIGHTGTLDPIATGVLVCLVGKYTKLGNLLTSYEKEYIAEIKLGFITDTGDITGNIIESKESDIDWEDIKGVFQNFPKEYEQTVPKYSAVKVNGKRLYEYARNDEEVDLPKRKVQIFELELISYEKDIIKFRTLVSKGTYIRSLIADLCANLGVFGVMSSLVRTKQGNFSIEDSFTIEDIEQGNFCSLMLKDFLEYPVLEIPKEYLNKVLNGGLIPNIFKIKDKVILMSDQKEVAIYQINDENTLKPYVMF